VTFTYASTSTTISDLSWIRLRLFDTSSATMKLTDEEIAALVSIAGNRYAAAVLGAETIAGKYAVSVDKTVGKLSISQGSVSQQYTDLAKRLRLEANLRATPFAGGISADQKLSEEQDSDRVAPAFSVDQFEAPGSMDDGSSAF
jgi:hypothetical protein